MLSDDIKNLQQHFRLLRAENDTILLGTEAVDQMNEQLASWAEQAEQMENQPVPLPSRLTKDHLNDPVVTVFPIVARSKKQDGGNVA